MSESPRGWRRPAGATPALGLPRPWGQQQRPAWRQGAPHDRQLPARVYKAAVARVGLDHLDLRGPHDLRHTFSTWLEDTDIPTRVIDEVMGHEETRRGELRGSAMGSVYRHTTAAMHDRVRAAIDERLARAVSVAAPLRPRDDEQLEGSA